MSVYLTCVINQIPKEYGLNLNQLLTPFNHCVKLLYLFKNNVETQSSM